MKNDSFERIARIRYCKRCALCGGGEAYIIETLDGSGEWVINKVHPLRLIPGDHEPNFVHYTMINDLMALSGIGYKFAPQVSD